MAPDLITKIDELRALVENYGGPIRAYTYIIGIGITTHNRAEVFEKTYKEIEKYSPGCKIVVVDDASVVPVKGATFRFNTNVGIAVAKNKCFELLDDCDHIFLFDDDTYPIAPDWFLPYVQSPEPHLMYIFEDFQTPNKLNDTAVIYKGHDLVAYSHPRGCMTYFKRICLEKVGGMNAVYGRWGWEHPDLSNRIFNAGLTTFRYADVPDSNKLIYSGDEHEAVRSTVIGAERQKWIQRNKSIYESHYNDDNYISYKKSHDLILTCYYNGVADPQRGQQWNVSMDAIQPLIQSVKALQGPKLVILSDCLPEMKDDTAEVVRDECVISPYFQRWISYGRFLRENESRYNKVFCVDATDVEVLRNPFVHVPFEGGKIYSGYEPDRLDCEWMVNKHRNPRLLDLFKAYGSEVLLNAGVTGGMTQDVIKVCSLIADAYHTMLADTFYRKEDGPGLTDMGIYNYVLRYDSRHLEVITGPHVTTRFKANERNGYSWFKHK